MLSAHDIDSIYSMWQHELKMQKLPKLKSNNHIGKTYNPDCFYYNGYVLRMDFWNNMLIIESADSIAQANNDDFEDGYTYDTSYPISEILSTMKSDIISDFGSIA